MLKARLENMGYRWDANKNSPKKLVYTERRLNFRYFDIFGAQYIAEAEAVASNTYTAHRKKINSTKHKRHQNCLQILGLYQYAAGGLLHYFALSIYFAGYGSAFAIYRSPQASL